MADFLPEFDKVVKAEGGYVNNSSDAGGETYLGISRRAHPNSPMWPIVDKTKAELGTFTSASMNKALKANTQLDGIIRGIYKSDYWDAMRLDKVNSQKIAHQMFDMGVNAGNSRAIKFAEKIVGMKETGKMSDELVNKLNDVIKV